MMNKIRCFSVETYHFWNQDGQWDDKHQNAYANQRKKSGEHRAVFASRQSQALYVHRTFQG